jgi:hypothetical protein
MENSKLPLYIGKGIHLDEDRFYEVWNKITNFYPQLNKTVERIKRVHVIQTEKEYLEWLQATYNCTIEHASSYKEGYELKSMDYGFSGLNEIDEHSIIVNMYHIYDVAAYYVRQTKEDGNEYWEFAKENSRFMNLIDYTKSFDDCLNFLFWNNLIHEIRHSEQELNPILNMSQFQEYLTSPEENVFEEDAVGFTKHIFNSVLNREERNVLTVNAGFRI